MRWARSGLKLPPALPLVVIKAISELVYPVGFFTGAEARVFVTLNAALKSRSSTDRDTATSEIALVASLNP